MKRYGSCGHRLRKERTGRSGRGKGRWFCPVCGVISKVVYTKEQRRLYG